MYSDEDIMLRFSRGETDLVNILYKRYKDKIYSYLIHLSFDEDLSKDLLQNVFYRIIKYKGSFKEGAKFRPWIYQIARNCYRDYLKKEGKQRNDFTDIGEIQLQSEARIDEIERTETIKNLQTALSRVSNDHREVLLMKGYQMLKNSEIASILNCTEGAVKGKVFRAMKSLRKEFFELENK